MTPYYTRKYRIGQVILINGIFYQVLVRLAPGGLVPVLYPLITIWQRKEKDK